MSTLQRIRIQLPEEVKKHNSYYTAYGTRVFVDDKEILNLSNIVVTFPVQGPVAVNLTILSTGGDELEFDCMAEVSTDVKKEEKEIFEEG